MYGTAYNIARQVDDIFPAGADVALQPLGVRDDYTSLTWLGGETALVYLSRPTDPSTRSRCSTAIRAAGARSRW